MWLASEQMLYFALFFTVQNESKKYILDSVCIVFVCGVVWCICVWSLPVGISACGSQRRMLDVFPITLCFIALREHLTKLEASCFSSAD